MTLAALSLALTVVGQANAAAVNPITFPSASVAFEKGVMACEAVYTGALTGEKSDPDKPGPFSQRGFYMSASGDEAKVNMLMLGQQAHVYKGSVEGAAGVVYIVFSRAPLACRVASFDAPDSHEGVLEQLNKRGSGWVAQATTSPSPAAKMQLFRKEIVGKPVTLNLSWPVARGKGPNGLAAMATMIVQDAASVIR
ncbi:MAG: hypothetical protein JHC57_11115 [Sphingopyxis sp.]|uniref:hypothetical protein n=1 Tax=Sphingopyxis sp. TaxID=1908224 RepID=UPI001A1F3031|nr:hypothetical protein [Sphingopyxis sp.]MBJ7500288.1 hypothetical protein [Sphingopyxis sp.]